MAYQSYSDVPWYRRSGVNSWFLILGGLAAPFLAEIFRMPEYKSRPAVAVCVLVSLLFWWTCISLATGDIYYPRQREDGNLETWSKPNKIAAWILLIVQVVMLFRALWG